MAALGAIRSILAAAKSIIAFVEENKNERWFQQASETFSRLREAKTSEERKRLAKDISRLIGSM